MHSFKDATGKKWEIDINVLTIKKMRDANMSIDFGNNETANDWLKVVSDPVSFFCMLYVLLDADKENLDETQFLMRFKGDAMKDATEAFLQEYSDFLPKDRREGMKKALSKAEKAEAELMKIATDQVDKADPKKLAKSYLKKSSK